MFEPLKQRGNHRKLDGGIAPLSTRPSDAKPETGALVPRSTKFAVLRMAPEELSETVKVALTACAIAHPEVQATLDHLECFQPGRPQPTHRISAP